MKNKKELFLVIITLLVACFFRFFNLMHDAPYFFNPDERNMASAITRFELPKEFPQIIMCLTNEFNLPVFPKTPSFSSLISHCNLNPHFFAYGQFPLYLAFISDQITKIPISLINQNQFTTHNVQLTTDFPSAIFWLRFWSALSSTFTVLLVYLIVKKLIICQNTTPPTNNYNLPIITALMTTFSPGLIQAAHFGTTESLLTFLFLLTVYLSFQLFTQHRRIVAISNWPFVFSLKLGFLIFALILSIGLGLGTKLTGIFFFIPPFTGLIIRIIELFLRRKKQKLHNLLTNLSIGWLLVIGSIGVGILSSPYNLVEFENFKSAVFGYEKDVAMGKYEAFYTRQFVNTLPLLFQIEKIFPYALGWPIFILGILGFLIIIFRFSLKFILFLLFLKKIKNQKWKIVPFDSSLFVLIVAFLSYLFPNSFLFVKWTRFMTPIFPFFPIFAIFALSFFFRTLNNFTQKSQKLKILNILKILIVILSLVPGLAFMSIYTHEDTRVQASRWIYQNIPQNSYILSETANVVDIPLSLPDEKKLVKNYEVISFDFYHLEKNLTLFEQLLFHLEKADYIFVPSRRIFFNYLRLPKTYPLVTKYYQLLFSGKLGFEKVAEISSFPRVKLGIWRWEFPDEQSEETFTVFDHPVIRIYKKVKHLTKEQYLNLWRN